MFDLFGNLEWIIGGVVAVLGFAWGFFAKGKRSGKKEIAHDILSDSAERQDKGRKAVRDGRASGGSPDDRVRSNDSKW